MSDEESAAFEWLWDNIEERDAMEWECRVDDMEDADNPDGNPPKTTASWNRTTHERPGRGGVLAARVDFSIPRNFY